ncbi:MAG: chromosome partitioning protein ParB, partial [Clostridiales Family XIII bacterium]|nr:chromosome partitioning protein ParB [Clostridiales Family XIII bacterium]
LLPSEKARAYKMKLDAIKRKAGRPAQNAAPDNMGQLVPNSSGLRSTEIVGAESGESYKQVQRYIRLTNLTQPLLDMVDEKRIAFSPAVELSYLPEKEQTELVEAMQLMDCTPSLSQAIRMKNESKDGTLTADRIGEILCEEKPNQRERVSFKVERLREFFPKNTTAEQMERKIIKLLDDERRRQQERKQREPDIGNTR